MRIVIIIFLLTFSFSNFGFAQQSKEFNNIVVLLDLSNRIKPDRNPQQASKDQKIILGLLEEFQKMQQPYLFQISKDKIRVEVAYQRESQYDTYQYGEDLHIDMSTSKMNKPIFDDRKELFKASITDLYTNAVKSKTTGADIWSYFRDNLPSVLEEDTEEVVYRNKLIILTDGYMDLDKNLAEQRPAGTFMNYYDIAKLRNNSNWKEVYKRNTMNLLPHNIKYQNLEVLVLEVIPKDPSVNVNEFPIVKKYWSDWLENMGIEHEIHASNDNVNNTLTVINRFVNSK